jgi:hypothetical protein
MAGGTILSATQWDAFLKELYPTGVPEDILQRDHTFLSMVSKDTEAYGDYMVIPVTYGLPSGRSASIASVLGANGPIGPSKSVKFTPSLIEDYGATWIDELTMLKASNDRGSFVNARKFEIDAVLTQLGESLSHSLFRAGDGTIGQGNGSWTITGAVVTLSRKADTKFFSLGQHLDFIAATGAAVGGAPTGSARALAATYRVTVTKIDEDAGTITCAEDSNGVAVTNISSYYTSLANTDWIAPVGDYNSAYATTGAEKIKGLAAWIPLVAPSASESFWGVDRSVHPTRLAGHRLDDSTAPAEDSIMALAEIMRERGARPKVCILSPRQFTKVSKRLNAKVEYSGAGGNADYGFSSFGVATSAGVLKVMTDSDCPEDRGYLLNMDTWKLKHLGGLPHIVATDGLTMLRRSASDSVEIRARYYAQLVCTNPGQNGVFSVS